MIVCLGLLMLLFPPSEGAAGIEVEKELAWLRLRESTSAAMFNSGEVARLEVESILEKVRAITPDGYTVDSMLADISEATDAVSSATLEKIEWVNDLKPEDKTWEGYLGEVATSATATATSLTMEKLKWAEGELEKRRPEVEKAVKELRLKTESAGRSVTSGTLEVLGDFRRGWDAGGESVDTKKAKD